MSRTTAVDGPWRPLVEELERYLRREGFARAALPGQVGLPSAKWVWAVSMGAIGCLVGGAAGGSRVELVVSTAGPLLLCLGAFGILRASSTLGVPLRSGLTGLIVLAGTAVAGGVLVGWLLRGVLWLVVYLLCATLIYLLWSALFPKQELMLSVSDAWRVGARAAVRALRAMWGVLPLMVVFLLLFVFSGELWLSLAVSRSWQFATAVALVLAIGVVAAVTRTGGVVGDIKKPEVPSHAELVREVGSFLWPESVGRPVDVPPDVDAVLQWRDARAAHAVAYAEAYRVLGWRIVARIAASALLVGAMMAAYLWALLYLLFSGQTIRAFQRPLGLSGISVETSFARVIVFLVAFVVTYFVVQAVTNKSIRDEMSSDLASELERWVSALMLYEGATSRGYQLTHTPDHYRELRLTYLQVAVPEGASEEAVRRACGHAAARFGRPGYVGLVTACDVRERGPYDPDMPGRRYQLVSYPGDALEFAAEVTAPGALRHTHDVGAVSGGDPRTVPIEWFGCSLSDQIVGRDLWEEVVGELDPLHIYCCSMGHALWVFLRLRWVPGARAIRRRLAEEVANEVVLRKRDSWTVLCVSLYDGETSTPFGRLYRRQDSVRSVYLEEDVSPFADPCTGANHDCQQDGQAPGGRQCGHPA